MSFEKLAEAKPVLDKYWVHLSEKAEMQRRRGAEIDANIDKK